MPFLDNVQFIHNAKNFFHSERFQDYVAIVITTSYAAVLFHMNFLIFRWSYMQMSVRVRRGNCGGHIAMSCFVLPISIGSESSDTEGKTGSSHMLISLRQ